MGLVAVAGLALLAGCVTTPEEAGYGVQADRESYVPARTSIIPCRVWPNGARYLKLPLTSAKDPELKSLCDAVDSYVLEGFNNQPYMKGFTPKFVQKALAAANQTPLVAGLDGIWQHQPGDCLDCGTAPAYYRSSIAKRVAWQTWLQSLSTAVKNSDAVLMPFVTYAYEKRYDDRGLDVHERAAGVLLLLVGTAKGELIWAGGREAVVPAKRLRSGNVVQDLPAPPWSMVHERLLSDDLWREYPGRQTL